MSKWFYTAAGFGLWLAVLVRAFVSLVTNVPAFEASAGLLFTVWFLSLALAWFGGRSSK